MSTYQPSMLKVDLCAAAVFTFLTAAGYLFGIEPWLRARRDAERSRADLSAVVSQQADAERAVAAARERLSRLQARLDEVGITLLPADKINDRLATLTGLADRLNLRIDQLEPGRPQLDARYTAVPIRMTGRGDFVSCVEYLARLHAGARDVAVTTLKLTRDPTGLNSSSGATTPASFQFELKWYATPEEYAAVAAPASP
jgi:Tfp pilus assembly protein PilO